MDGLRMVIGWCCTKEVAGWRNSRRPRRSPSTSVRSTSARSICSWTRASTPTAPTSSGQPSGGSSRARPPTGRPLEARPPAVDATAAGRPLTLGSRHVSRRELEELRDSGRTIELRALGLATVAHDAPAELALATITAVEVLGAFRAPKEVKAALAGRIA